MSVRILIGDMRERLKELPDASIDSCVTDPPYHLTSIVKRFGKTALDDQNKTSERGRNRADGMARLSRGFMGQTWDGGDVAFDPETWAEVFRVLKPGGHLIAFSGTRTYHRMAVAIEDAGFEIRDMLSWLYGSGFPKSHNQPGGLGTALKPACEPIAFARKPLVGTVAANVLEHGTGALNIDACRIAGEAKPFGNSSESEGYRLHNRAEDWRPSALGRWPANVIHDGSPEVVAMFPSEAGAAAPVHRRGGDKFRTTYGSFAGNIDEAGSTFHGDSGSAARFFYSAKTDSAERHAGCEDLEKGNNHPTVKPIDLMRWLCRLVTPKGGTVLDPFMGSGSTMIAADAEQFDGIGCELSPEYAAIAERRIRASAGLFAEVRAA